MGAAQKLPIAAFNMAFKSSWWGRKVGHIPTAEAARAMAGRLVQSQVARPHFMKAPFVQGGAGLNRRANSLLFLFIAIR